MWVCEGITVMSFLFSSVNELTHKPPPLSIPLFSSSVLFLGKMLGFDASGEFN